MHEQYHKYMAKKLEADKKFIKNFYTANEKEKTLLVLECCEANIYQYSLNGRTGYKKYLKKAIKLLKNLNMEDFE